jgi:hypothetical protein
MVKATIRPLTGFSLSEKTGKKIPEILRDVLKKQAKDGVLVSNPSGDNSRVATKKKAGGGRINLIDTGSLWKEAIFGYMKLILPVRYAEFVIAKYAAGLSPRYKEIFAARVGKELARKGAIVLNKAQ